MFKRMAHTSAIPVIVITITFAMFLTAVSPRTLATTRGTNMVILNAEKHVQIKVELHGNIDHHTVDSVEHLVMEWLEAAHLVVSHTDGANYLHLHVRVEVNDNHHFGVHSDCAEWHEDKEAATVDLIDEILHHMISDFIEKYSH